MPPCHALSRVITSPPLFARKPPEEKPVKRASGDRARVIRELAPYLGVGMTLAVTILLGLLGGHWLDARFGTRPLFILVGGGLGLGLALYQFFRTVAGLKR
jgi:ATP synthase protein I